VNDHRHIPTVIPLDVVMVTHAHGSDVLWSYYQREGGKMRHLFTINATSGGGFAAKEFDPERVMPATMVTS
jgi:hypothetical protein